MDPPCTCLLNLVPSLCFNPFLFVDSELSGGTFGLGFTLTFDIYGGGGGRRPLGAGGGGYPL